MEEQIMKDRVSIIIPTLGLMPQDIFRYSMQQLMDCEVVKEIIIIDNTNNTSIRNNFGDIIKDKVILIDTQPNLYVNPAWNYGISMTTSDYYLLLNDDVGVHKDTIVTCVEHLDKNIDTYILVVSSHENRINLTIDQWLADRELFLTGNKRLTVHDHGQFMMGRKAEFIPFDDRLKIGFGDNLLWEVYPSVFGKIPHCIENDIVLHIFHSTLDKVKTADYTHIGVDKRVVSSSGERAVFDEFRAKVQKRKGK